MSNQHAQSLRSWSDVTVKSCTVGPGKHLRHVSKSASIVTWTRFLFSYYIRQLPASQFIGMGSSRLGQVHSASNSDMNYNLLIELVRM